MKIEGPGLEVTLEYEDRRDIIRQVAERVSQIIADEVLRNLKGL